MANALPIILAGGAAFLMMGGKKKKKASDTGKELPDVGDDDEPGVTGGGTPEPKPSSEPGVTPEPESEPESEPEPVPGPSIPAPEQPKRPLGPSGVGSCANSIYRRDAVYIEPAIADRLSQGALTLYNDVGYYFHIRSEFQDEIFDAGLKTFAAMAAQKSAPSLRSVVLREILMGDSNNKCDWDAPTDDFDAPMSLVWGDGMRLMTLAQVMAGYGDPHPDNLFKTGKRYTVPRKPLGMPDPGFPYPTINQRVMILATDKGLQNAEHLIGRVSKLSGPNGESDRFEIRIVDTFNGEDTRPKRTLKHGFKDLSNAFFMKAAPTGIYRFYPQGTV